MAEPVPKNGGRKPQNRNPAHCYVELMIGGADLCFLCRMFTLVVCCGEQQRVERDLLLSGREDPTRGGL